MYVIMISAFGGTEACMHVGIYRFYPCNSDVEWQHPIEFVGQLDGVNKLFVVEMRNHRACMNTSICATSPNKFYRMA